MPIKPAVSIGFVVLTLLVLIAVALAGASSEINDKLSPARADGRWQQRDVTNNSRIIASEPYWTYPIEYFIFRQHPSRYYYTFPDRYYC